MTVRGMHYDFKQKLNKIDSQKYRNLEVPEIDWKLNEAQEVFVKIVAQPSLANQLGFEVNQRSINDIRTIVVDQRPSEGITPTVFDSSSYIAELPEDYWFLVKSRILATKGSCQNIELKAREVQHDDEHELSPFDKSSFEWRVSNIRFNKEGIRIFTDGSYVINKIILEYLKRPIRIHNAVDFEGGTYEDEEGNALTGSQNCELPSGVHTDIVDLAVLITAGDLNLPDYGLKQAKVRLTKG